MDGENLYHDFVHAAEQTAAANVSSQRPSSARSELDALYKKELALLIEKITSLEKKNGRQFKSQVNIYETRWARDNTPTGEYRLKIVLEYTGAGLSRAFDRKKDKIVIDCSHVAQHLTGSVIRLDLVIDNRKTRKDLKKELDSYDRGANGIPFGQNSYKMLEREYNSYQDFDHKTEQFHTSTEAAKIIGDWVGAVAPDRVQELKSAMELKKVAPARGVGTSCVVKSESPQRKTDS